MFTGITGPLGIISDLFHQQACVQLTIVPQLPFIDLALGESIAVNGVCLTVTDFSNDKFQVVAVPETLSKTNLKQLSINTRVNLERAMQLHGRMGGHYVQGHVDGVAEIIDWQPVSEGVYLARFRVSQPLTKYIVDKGYIAIDGMSLTVINCEQNCFTVTLVPHTLQTTIAQHYQIGTWVNIEVDIFSKYIEKIIGG